MEVLATRIVFGLACTAFVGGPALAQRAATPIGSPAEWFGPNNYPAEALRARQEGRVVVVVSIDTAGRPTACRVVKSSGAAPLDAGTCAVAMEKAYFTPAADRRGRPIAGTYTLPVSWLMPDGTLMPETLDIEQVTLASTGLHIEGRVTIGPDGVVTSCTLDPLPSDDKVNYCAEYPVGKQMKPIITRGSRRVGGQILFSWDVKTIYDP